MTCHFALAATPSPCDSLPIPPDKLVGHTVFPTTLTPFGQVCFVAHWIPDPTPPDENPPPTSAPPYIAFSLIKNAGIIYNFPIPDPGLWNQSDDGIVSVAFRKLHNDKFTDVLIIGHNFAANGNDLYPPLIYRGTGTGFILDTSLSEALAEQIIPDLPTLLQAIAKASHPPPH